MTSTEALQKARACPILGGRCHRSYGTKLLGTKWKYKNEVWFLVGFYLGGAHFYTKNGIVAARFTFVKSKLKALLNNKINLN